MQILNHHLLSLNHVLLLREKAFLLLHQTVHLLDGLDQHWCDAGVIDTEETVASFSHRLWYHIAEFLRDEAELSAVFEISIREVVAAPVEGDPAQSQHLARRSGASRNPEERCLDSGLRRSDDRDDPAGAKESTSRGVPARWFGEAVGGWTRRR